MNKPGKPSKRRMPRCHGAVQGTGDQEAGEAVGLLAGAVADLGRINQTLTTSGGRPELSAVKDQLATPAKLDPDKVEELRAKLPPSVPKPNPENRKTYGQWIHSQGKVPTTASGEDQASAAARSDFNKAGMPPSRKPVITTHVEAKVAAGMIRSGQRHTELVFEGGEQW